MAIGAETWCHAYPRASSTGNDSMASTWVAGSAATGRPPMFSNTHQPSAATARPASMTSVPSNPTCFTANSVFMMNVYRPLSLPPLPR